MSFTVEPSGRFLMLSVRSSSSPFLTTSFSMSEALIVGISSIGVAFLPLYTRTNSPFEFSNSGTVFPS